MINVPSLRAALLASKTQYLDSLRFLNGWNVLKIPPDEAG